MAYENVKIKPRQTVAPSSQTKDLGIVTNVPMGDWTATTPYMKLNMVRSHNATYQAKKNNQGVEPTVTTGWQDIWQVVAYDGRGVANTEVSYQAGTSNNVIPTGEWTSDIPDVPQGQYLWTRTIYQFTDGSDTPSYSVSLQGLGFTQEDRDNIERITDAIPSSATEDNPLTTEAFVNSSVNAMAAFYITYTQGTDTKPGEAFPTLASLLNATTFYSGKSVRVPTQNDYVTVLSDESQPKGPNDTYPTTRYTYQTDTQDGTYPNGQWALSFIVNSTSFTQAQLNALNSGITSALVNKLDDIEVGAQKNPTNYVTTDTFQKITAGKTFELHDESAFNIISPNGDNLFGVLDYDDGTKWGISIDDDITNEVPISLQGSDGEVGRVIMSQGAGKTPRWLFPVTVNGAAAPYADFESQVNSGITVTYGERENSTMGITIGRRTYGMSEGGTVSVSTFNQFVLDPFTPINYTLTTGETLRLRQTSYKKESTISRLVYQGVDSVGNLCILNLTAFASAMLSPVATFTQIPSIRYRHRIAVGVQAALPITQFYFEVITTAASPYTKDNWQDFCNDALDGASKRELFSSAIAQTTSTTWRVGNAMIAISKNSNGTFNGSYTAWATETQSGRTPILYYSSMDFSSMPSVAIFTDTVTPLTLS